ncbi:MAG: phenylalanine--tRNA ligase subunit alpha [Pseudomonadota bacterium]
MNKTPTAQLKALIKEARAAIAAGADPQAWEAVRVAYLGRKGSITTVAKRLSELLPEERRDFGRLFNEIKEDLLARITKAQAAYHKTHGDARLMAGRIDASAPIRPELQGSIHPISQTMSEIIEIMARMGFAEVRGPDIEDDWHNFTALNFLPDHPARDMQDTFYLASEETPPPLLRTHTSPSGQIRTMLSSPPPYRVICPGRVFRCDADSTHSPMFHQIEGLWIDRDVTMGHLKGCLVQLVQAFFDLDDPPLRFRPSFFPFTEPSMEVDIRYRRSEGKLILGEGEDWMEILGCGMTHPNVLRSCKVPEEYQGFAFGLGVERLTMLKHGISDIRNFYASDMRWLRHYGFSVLEAALPRS